MKIIEEISLDRRKYDRDYYLKNKEKKLKREKNRYLNNGEKIKNRVNDYYLNNKEKIKERDVKYYSNNREKILKHKKEYYSNNIKKIEEYRLNHKEYYDKYNKEYHLNNRNEILENKKEYYRKNKNKINKQSVEHRNDRKSYDMLYKLKCNVRSLIISSIKLSGYKKASKTQNILGCTLKDFKKHLESKFESWMNWDNYGNWNGEPRKINVGWDIDHIIPLSTAKTEEEVLKLNHYTNLQPLCSYTNRHIKSGNIIIINN